MGIMEIKNCKVFNYFYTNSNIFPIGKLEVFNLILALTFNIIFV